MKYAWLALFAFAVLFTALSVLSWQQSKIEREVAAVRKDIAALQVVTTTNYADSVAARTVLDEMRVSMAGSVNDLHALQSSMELSVGESIEVYNNAAQAIVEIDSAVEYMRQWVEEHFPK